VGSTEKVGVPDCVYLSVRACTGGMLPPLPTRSPFRPHIHPPRPPPRPSHPRWPMALSLRARLAACIFTPSTPLVAYYLSFPTHLLARLYAHLDSHIGPTPPDRLPSPPPRPLPRPPDAHLIYCVLPAKVWAGQGVREGVQMGGHACVGTYGRSVHVFMEGFV